MTDNYRDSQVTLPLSLSAYASGDVVGGRFKFGNLLSPQEGGYVVGARLLNFGTSHPDFRLHLFTRPLTIPADNSALTLTAAELVSCPYYKVIDFADTDTVELASGIRNNEQVSQGLLPIEGELYGVLEAKGSYTAVAADDLTLWVYVDSL